MDVAQEFRSANYRIKMTARRRALEAEARIYGMDPQVYIMWVLEAQRLDDEERYRVAAQQAQDGMEAVGASFGRMTKAIGDMINSFNKGFIAGMQG